ncbi:MAG: alpha/beta hydrolase [Mesorhizobium sp.]|nr:alpha/beta hydrolase [Mesorhizobium sp.]MCO5162494.1 alpha/beta hydrolase [Mesorhizobium sp.]
MAIFLFVHGAWHSGWCFEPLSEILRGEGHQVIAPDLPGMGGDETTLSAVTLEAWGKFVAELASAQAEPVMLCGHSRGGAVISTAAEMAPEALRALVFIAAFLLPDGDCPAAFKARMPRANGFADLIEVIGEGAGTRVPPEAAATYFYNTTSAKARLAATQCLLADPFKPSRTPLRLSEERFGSIPRYYVECTKDLIIPLAEQRLMREMLRVEAVETLDCDHSPFLSDSGGLGRALLRFEKHASASSQ